MKAKKSENKCAKYGIAITNYVLGEDLRMPPEELYAHLKDCPKCLDELKDWQEVSATMRTEAYHQTPEAGKRYQELLEKIRQLPGPDLPALPPECFREGRSAVSPGQAGMKPGEPCTVLAQGEQLFNDEVVIGTVAGKIYNYLGPNGKQSYPAIRIGTGILDHPFYEAMGWLAREKKICRSKDATTFYAALAPAEKDKYQTQSQTQA